MTLRILWLIYFWDGPDTGIGLFNDWHVLFVRKDFHDRVPITQEEYDALPEQVRRYDTEETDTGHVLLQSHQTYSIYSLSDEEVDAHYRGLLNISHGPEIAVISENDMENRYERDFLKRKIL